MAKVIEVSQETVQKYHDMAELARGTRLWSDFCLQHEYKNTSGRWRYIGWGNILIYIYQSKWYLKEVKGNMYLYREECGDADDRYLLREGAKKFFIK